MTILETNSLTKKYKRLTALDQLNFSLQQGMVFGLLGPNGSGKTTTLGMLLDVLQPTSGSYKWFGSEPSADSRKKIGAILEIPSFFPYLTALQSLRIIAQVKEIKKPDYDGILKTVGLFERRNDNFRTFSLGMKQRLAIGAALLADPPVLILDEPTNGLDPQGIVEIRQLIKDIAGSGKTIILASHLLDEVQKVCSDFMVLQKGKKVFQGNVKDALSEQTRIVVGADDLDGLRSAISNMRGVGDIELENELLVLSFAENVGTRTISQYLFDKKIVLTHLSKREGSLEQKFLNILAENG